MTEAVAREKFQQRAAIIPPEIGLRLYARDPALGRTRLVAEKIGGSKTANANESHPDSRQPAP